MKGGDKKMLQKLNMNLLRMLLIAVFVCITAPPDIADATGTAAGTSIQNTASVSYEDASANSYAANSNTTTVTVQSVYSVSVSAPANSSGASNTTVYYAYTVTNTSNDTNTFALTTTDGSWTGTLYVDDGAGGGTANDGVHQAGETTVTASTGALAADATYKLFMAVAIPNGEADGNTDNTTLNVVGSGDAGAGDDTTDQVTTTANAPSLTITKNVRNVTDAGAFNTTANADPTDTLEYRITVANSGAVSATAIVLTDNDNANTTFVAASIWIGDNGTTNNGASNVNVDDNSSGAETCAADECGQANADGSGNITAYLGNGSTESAGGSLGAGSTVYVYFRVTVD